MNRGDLKRVISRGIRLDTKMYERLIVLLNVVRQRYLNGYSDSLVRCLEVERFTISSLIYCIVKEYLPTLEYKYMRKWEIEDNY